MPLYFQRYYASYLRRSFVLGDLGNNWLHNFDHRLGWNGNSALYISSSGRVTRFLKLDGEWTQQDNLDIPYQVVIEAGSDPVVYDPQADLIYTFDYSTGGLVTGKLIEIENSRGNTHTMTYNEAGQLQTVSDGLGRILTFFYNTMDISKISVVSDGIRTIQFQYTDPLDSENLTLFTDAMGNFTSYAYEDTSTNADNALLLRRILPEGNIPYSQTYYTTAHQYLSGRVETQTD